MCGAPAALFSSGPEARGAGVVVLMCVDADDVGRSRVHGPFDPLVASATRGSRVRGCCSGHWILPVGPGVGVGCEILTSPNIITRIYQ